MEPLAILASILVTVSNITDRVTTERTAWLEEGALINEYERHMKSLEEHYKMGSGGGIESETKDMEHAVPRLKGLADIQIAGRAETPELRRAAAFVDTFSPILAMDDGEIKRFIAHLAKPDDDLGRSDKELFDKISGTGFQAQVATKLAKAGCGYTNRNFTYSSAKKLLKLAKQLEKRLAEIE